MCGFWFQTSVFLEMYLAYDTIVDIRVSSPDVVELPAITVCNNNRVMRTKICLDSPEVCIWENDKRVFCSLWPKYCLHGLPEDDESIVKARIPITTAIMKANRSLEYLLKYGQMKRDDIIEHCSLQSDVRIQCDRFVHFQAADNFGYPNNCYSIESLWERPNTMPRVIPITAKYDLWLSTHPEEYVKHDDLVLVNFLLHSPFALSNPMREGITLEGGKAYNIYMTMVTNQRLPFPYQTNCSDYLEQWRRNGGRGPLNAKTCQENCAIENMMKEIGCVPQSISYPNNNTICVDGGIFPSKEMRMACSEECSEACKDSSYTLRVEVAKDLSVKCGEKDLNCKYEKILIHLIFNRFQVTEFVNQPRFESIELFSYIGGYMGMWLGVSLVALFDFLETLAYLLSYPLLRSPNTSFCCITY
ncbi:amiloride-sensitive sodium channel subunit beta-2-like [Parasteatoda tepidariorum]|uniref:amiloride-sensitive sodium channel subunit beta-2-like n=1 Tax=Parasteatoda tepidariorum TaxID=114398 RepID=UPI0039BC4918